PPQSGPRPPLIGTAAGEGSVRRCGKGVSIPSGTSSANARPLTPALPRKGGGRKKSPPHKGRQEEKPSPQGALVTTCGPDFWLPRPNGERVGVRGNGPALAHQAPAPSPPAPLPVGARGVGFPHPRHPVETRSPRTRHAIPDSP